MNRAMSQQSTQRCRIVIQCNPLLDLQLTVDDQFLKRYNLKHNTSVIYSPQFRNLFDEIRGNTSCVTRPGGAGLNTARIAQWILTNAHLSRTVAYIGCIGQDTYGKTLQDAAQEDGVVMKLQTNSQSSTGLCAVLKMQSSSSRTLVADLGAAKLLSVQYLHTQSVSSCIEAAQVIYTTMYSIPFHATHTMQLASLTRSCQTGKLFAIGLSSTHILDVFGEDLVDFLEKLDFIFCDLDQLHDLAMLLQWVPQEMSDLELTRKVAQEMMYDGHSIRRVIVTRGSQPVLYATSNGDYGEVKTTPIRVGTVKGRATGAGDAFVGGFLADWVLSHDLIHSCNIGVKCATHVIDHGLSSLSSDNAPSLTE